MPSYTFSKAFQWAGPESLPGQFWAPDLMSDIPAVYEHATLNYSNKAWIKCAFLVKDSMLSR